MAEAPVPADRLSPAWQNQTQLLYRFDRAWQTGTPPRIEDFLPPVSVPAANGQRRQVLVELVLVDLEYRWRLAACMDRGATPPVERLRLEDYVGHYPELGRASELGVELVAQEYEVRHCWGDRPAHSDFLARFPHLQAALPPAPRASTPRSPASMRRHPRRQGLPAVYPVRSRSRRSRTPSGNSSSCSPPSWTS